MDFIMSLISQLSPLYTCAIVLTVIHPRTHKEVREGIEGRMQRMNGKKLDLKKVKQKLKLHLWKYKNREGRERERRQKVKGF